MPKKSWKYFGDVNLEYGGLFWQWDGGPDYVNAIDVTPCGDAGGPDNLFHIAKGSIYLPLDVDRRNSALNCIGYSARPAPLCVLVDAFHAYHGIDGDVYNAETIVRVGKPEECSASGWAPKPDVVLRRNASLKKYVEREFLS